MKFFALLALLLIAMPAAFAADDHAGHMMGHDMSKMDMSAAPSTVAYEKAMASMHKDMAITYTGNADTDFVKGMIPHHKGAVDMAKIELQYGKDPEIRKLAEDVVKAQEAEIKFMDAWLKAHPVK